MAYYYSMFFVSIVLVIVYAFIFHKHFDPCLTIIATLIPVTNLSFLLLGNSSTLSEAVAALKLTYLSGCFLLPFVMFLIFNICGVRLKPWQRAIIIIISSIVFISGLTIGQLDIFYVGMPELIHDPLGFSYLTNKHYGFMHTVFYVVAILYYAATIGVVIYSFIKKKQVTRTILILVAISLTIAIFGFFGGRLTGAKIELLPATQNIGMIIYIIIAARLRLYDASDSVTDSLVQKGDTGFISFDRKSRYLGSNDTAKIMFPELNDCVVDHPIKDESSRNQFNEWIAEFINDNENNKHLVEKGDKIYLVNVNRLTIGRLYHGYQFLITDDTVNQQHINLIRTYNEQLQSEVIKKTENIVEMQNKLVIGMATMVEGRDNSTGGHIRRTSDVVRFLVEEMQKDKSLDLSEEFYNDLIKAAPMHDLGKITIDDAILRKPGKFTPEEFEIMKTHAPQGARIVHQILCGTNDDYFMKIAVNVAHYHHERWDGSGYPKGLKGENIPLEARIMAIADVYDALVSKRVYKDSMSFENANSIIIDNMGKHFDKNLEKYYLGAKERIEQYYKESQN